MRRVEALKIVDELVTSKNIRSHCLAAEAAMIGLYEYFEKKGKIGTGTAEDWGIVGLLHDADYEVTNKSLELHTEETTKKLKEAGAPKEIIDAVRGHADKEPRNTMMAKAIYAADELTGLIVAAALVRPDKKLEGLTTESVLKRFKDSTLLEVLPKGSMGNYEILYNTALRNIELLEEVYRRAISSK